MKKNTKNSKSFSESSVRVNSSSVFANRGTAAFGLARATCVRVCDWVALFRFARSTSSLCQVVVSGCLCLQNLAMGISKTEVNLRRLLAAAPQQQNRAKLMHYVSTLREQLEQLTEERTPEGLPRVSKALVNEYSEKIEAIASKLDAPMASSEDFSGDSAKEISPTNEEEIPMPSSPGLRRRYVPAVNAEYRSRDTSKADTSSAVKLDASAQAHIEKHRKLQENLTDEMVVLARQLKESSLVMSQSVQNTEKILDSTEKAIEHSLAGTGRANVRAMEVYSKGFKTTCFTWLVMFLMTCIFIMVVLLIRIT